MRVNPIAKIVRLPLFKKQVVADKTKYKRKEKHPKESPTHKEQG